MSLDDPDLSRLIRQHATRHGASDDLRAGIRTQVALADAGRGAPAGRWRWGEFGWRTASLGFGFGLMVALLVVPVTRQFELGASLESELVSDHVRALQIGPLTQVASTDRHTVKPWFQGRLDFAVPVVDLAAQGVPLEGGRLDHLGGRPVAALVYRLRQHAVNLFLWPAPGAQPPRIEQARGLSAVSWVSGGFEQWLVSDAAEPELLHIAGLLGAEPVTR